MTEELEFYKLYKEIKKYIEDIEKNTVTADCSERVIKLGVLFEKLVDEVVDRNQLTAPCQCDSCGNFFAALTKTANICSICYKEKFGDSEDE